MGTLWIPCSDFAVLPCMPVVDVGSRGIRCCAQHQQLWGPSLTSCRSMYTATQGALVFDSVMGHQHSTYSCTYPGEQKNKQLTG